MELYTLDRTLAKLDVIENFESLIWTERYYGDGECEVVIPFNKKLIDKMVSGRFLAIDQSEEPMIIETFKVEEGKIKVSGISVLSWLNNRFIRKGGDHRRTNWKIMNKKPGEILWTVVREMCTAPSLGSGKMGLGPGATGEARERELIIPGLKLGAQDTSGSKVKRTLVPFGPLYDGLRKVAEQHKVGMQITLRDDDTSLRFRSYRGRDLTKGNDQVRFSPAMDSLINPNELRSKGQFKTLAYAYASGLEKVDTADENDDPDTWLQQDNKPGMYRRPGSKTEGNYTGFELRAMLVLADDIAVKNDLAEEGKSGEDTVAEIRADVIEALNDRAKKAVRETTKEYVRTVDGEIAPMNLFKYGIHYSLGDLVEVQGYTSLVEVSRVTEYIRTQDSQGEKAYPTVVAADAEE